MKSAGEATADGTKATVEQTPAEGSPTKATYTAKLDGKDPISGNPAVDTIAIKRIDDHTTETTLKKSGKVLQNGLSRPLLKFSGGSGDLM